MVAFLSLVVGLLVGAGSTFIFVLRPPRHQVKATAPIGFVPVAATTASRKSTIGF